MTPLAECRGLVTGYGPVEIGRDIALRVTPGEVLALLGPNGCGKTTLFRTLLGLIPPLEGEALLGGAAVEDLSRADIARRAAYVPQASEPSFPYTAFELVLMGRTARLGPLSQPGAADERAAEAALARLGLTALAHRPATELSGGQRQLILIARALAQEAQLLVMDEPTASLDFGNQARVLREVLGLARNGLGVILSTHDPGQAFAVADQAALMSGGRIVAQGPTEAVLTAEALGRVYDVVVDVERLASGRVVCAPRLDAH